MRPEGHRREDLVRVLISRGITEPRLIEAFREVPRAAFVPHDFVQQAYLDQPIPIPHGQVTTQPSLVAAMIEALQLSGDEKVLEIGSGYGFQTALLARLANFVWSIERWPDLAETARDNLARQEIDNVKVLAGDGTEGLPRHAPYDAIIVSAAFPEVPPPLVEQLVTGGRLVQPIGSGGSDDVMLFEKGAEDLIERRMITPARFVRLYGKHGFRQQ